MEAKTALRTLVLSTLALTASGCVFTWGDGDTTTLERDGGGFGGSGGSTMSSAGMGGSDVGSAGMGGSSMGGANMGGSGMTDGGDPAQDSGTNAMSDAAVPLVRSCDAAAGDDECVACLKAQCCEAWQGCNDASCDSEAFGTFSCMAELEFPADKDYRQCVSENAVSSDMLPQANTLGLLNCVQEEADPTDAGQGLSRCGEPCLGLTLSL